MKVLFASSEAYPFAMSGGLAEVAGALPKALSEKADCRVILPLYACVTEEMRNGMDFVCSFNVPVAWRTQYCGVFEKKVGNVVYYLLDNMYYFNREGLYGYYDDAERFAFFSRAVLEVIPKINFIPDIIHCNDWQTALIPVYIDSIYKCSELYNNIKTVFTIHNIQYQGKYGHELFADVLGLPSGKENLIDYDNCVNFMKGAIQCSNRITTVSNTYAYEILDPYYSYGLDNILRECTYKLTGILNGIDCDVYNPQTDRFIYKNYSAYDLSGKDYNKQKLQEELGLFENQDTPIVAMVTRFAKHKGIDLVKCVFEELLRADIEFAILGSGESEFETFFYEMSKRYPGKVGLKLGFDGQLAHRIYAGADIFLMPSQSEPCGLAQMIALRYGTIPIVRETGGLNDTVSDSGDGKGNGFTFKLYNAHDMQNTVWRALRGYANKEGFKKLQKRAMECDNSWDTSANKYMAIYNELIN